MTVTPVPPPAAPNVWSRAGILALPPEAGAWVNAPQWGNANSIVSPPPGTQIPIVGLERIPGYPPGITIVLDIRSTNGLGQNTAGIWYADIFYGSGGVNDVIRIDYRPCVLSIAAAWVRVVGVTHTVSGLTVVGARSQMSAVLSRHMRNSSGVTLSDVTPILVAGGATITLSIPKFARRVSILGVKQPLLRVDFEANAFPGLGVQVPLLQAEQPFDLPNWASGIILTNNEVVNTQNQLAVIWELAL